MAGCKHSNKKGREIGICAQINGQNGHLHGRWCGLGKTWTGRCCSRSLMATATNCSIFKSRLYLSLWLQPFSTYRNACSDFAYAVAMRCSTTAKLNSFDGNGTTGAKEEKFVPFRSVCLVNLGRCPLSAAVAHADKRHLNYKVQQCYLEQEKPRPRRRTVICGDICLMPLGGGNRYRLL